MLDRQALTCLVVSTATSIGPAVAAAQLRAGVSMGAWGAMLLGLKHHQQFGTVGALSAPYLISRQSPNMDMTSREQQRLANRDPPSGWNAIPARFWPLFRSSPCPCSIWPAATRTSS